jgi:hypothetical protein
MCTILYEIKKKKLFCDLCLKVSVTTKHCFLMEGFTESTYFISFD